MWSAMKKRVQRWIEDRRNEEEATERVSGVVPRAAPAPEEPALAEFAVPVPPKEKRHDGWAEIRRRNPGEDTDVLGMKPPDITDVGRSLRPVDGDDDDDDL
jgi:hypothetical protein